MINDIPLFKNISEFKMPQTIQTPPRKTLPEPILPFIIGLGIIAIIAIGYGLTMIWLGTNWEQRGQFGDMFGALNTLFSGLAFAALAYTLHLQRTELALQRQELAETRAELAKQASSQELQANTAMLAAEINALGSLFQAYSILLSNKYGKYIDEKKWEDEFRNVRDRLNHLLQEQRSRR